MVHFPKLDVADSSAVSHFYLLNSSSPKTEALPVNLVLQRLVGDFCRESASY